MKHEKIEILDVEEAKDSDKIKVVLEVPGKKYGQQYPKRITHTFPKKQSYFEKLDNGKRRYEKIIENLYLETDEDKNQRKKVDNKIEDIRNEGKGKKFTK